MTTPTSLPSALSVTGKLHGVKWRNNHRDLIRNGHDRVRAEGTRSGRPIGGQRVSAKNEREVAAALLIDQFGLFRALTVPLTPVRLLGGVLMVTGVILALRR